MSLVLVQSETTKVARPVGTTAQVHNLFAALPVRRVDLQRRIKSQRVKLFRMLQAYAITCVGVRLTVCDMKTVKGKGGKPDNIKSETKLNTGLSTKISQTMTSVLGAKFVSGMTEFSMSLDETVMILRGGLSGMSGFAIKGLVAKPPTGESAVSGARDLQFFSVNGRPVDIPNFTRAISDAWRNFDHLGKKPAVALDINLPNSMFDVNLSPDKREVFMADEAKFCDVLKERLVQFWKGSDGSFVSGEVQEMSKEKKMVAKVQKTQQTRKASDLKESATALEASLKRISQASASAPVLAPVSAPASAPTSSSTSRKISARSCASASSVPAPPATQSDLLAWRKVARDFNSGGEKNDERKDGAHDHDKDYEDDDFEVRDKFAQENSSNTVTDFLAFKARLKSQPAQFSQNEDEDAATAPSSLPVKSKAAPRPSSRSLPASTSPPRSPRMQFTSPLTKSSSSQRNAPQQPAPPINTTFDSFSSTNAVILSAQRAISQSKQRKRKLE